jgi:hypothetical protein
MRYEEISTLKLSQHLQPVSHGAILQNNKVLLFLNLLILQTFLYFTRIFLRNSESNLIPPSFFVDFLLQSGRLLFKLSIHRLLKKSLFVTQNLFRGL